MTTTPKLPVAIQNRYGETSIKQIPVDSNEAIDHVESRIYHRNSLAIPSRWVDVWLLFLASATTPVVLVSFLRVVGSARWAAVVALPCVVVFCVARVLWERDPEHRAGLAVIGVSVLVGIVGAWL